MSRVKQLKKHSCSFVSPLPARPHLPNQRSNLFKNTRQEKWVLPYKPDLETPFGLKTYEEYEDDILAPMGMSFHKKHFLPVVKTKQLDNCKKLFALQMTTGNQSLRNIPFTMKWQYTLNGYVSLVEDFKSGHYLDEKTLDIESLENALRSIPVRNKKGLIYGIAAPTIETLLKHLSASADVVDLVNISQLTFTPPIQQDELEISNYDFLISLSYLENIGFGNHGEQMDPELDLKEIQKMRCLLKDDGYLFVSVPIGQDIVQWNQKRIYGRIRLPLLIADYEILEAYYNGSALPLTPEVLKNAVITNNFENTLLVLKKV